MISENGGGGGDECDEDDGIEGGKGYGCGVIARGDGVQALRPGGRTHGR